MASLWIPDSVFLLARYVVPCRAQKQKALDINIYWRVYLARLMQRFT